MNISNNVLGWYRAAKWQRTLMSVITLAALLTWTAGPLATNAAVVPATNPSLGDSCGLDIALVLDHSTSISNTEYGQMKTAVHGFVNSLLPATPTEFSVTDFASTASLVQGFTSNASTVNTAVDLPQMHGSTNWEAGLTTAASSFDPRPASANVIIFASDGEPNKYGANQGSGSGFVQAALDAAVNEANAIKSGGTRIITLGIGITSGNVAHMKAISSDDAYYDAASFADLPATLATIATDLCGGTITVHKVIDRDGNLETTGDQTPGEGWNFTIAGQSGQVTDEFGKTPAVHVDGIGPWSVVETPQAHYSLVAASCENQSQVAHGTSDVPNSQVSGITLDDQDVISCTFYNVPQSGLLTVTKVVNNDNGTGSSIPTDFNFNVQEQIGTSSPFVKIAGLVDNGGGTQATLDGASSYNVTENNPGAYAVDYSADCNAFMGPSDAKHCTVTNSDLPADKGSITVSKVVINNNGGAATLVDFPLHLTDGDSNVTNVTSGASNLLNAGTYTISEDLNAPGYTQTDITCTDGSTVTHDAAVALVAGHSVDCQVTNDDLAPSLTLVKEVSGGSATADEWTLTATGNQQSPSVVTGPGGATSDAGLQAGLYTLSELATGQDTGNYEAGNWSCSPVENDGNSVSIGLGQHTTCTITNTFVPTSGADLSVTKVVDDNTPDDNQNITYSIVVHNDGPDAASDVNVSDVLPAGLSYVSSSATTGSYDSGTGVWAVGSLLEDSSETLTIVAQVGSDESGDTITNTASVTSGETTDPDHENNSADVSVTVNGDEDVCNNIPGVQTQAPDGQQVEGNGECHNIPNNGGGGGGGGGGPIFQSSGGGGGGGFVLGASTQGQVLGVSCGLALDQHMRKDSPKNKADKVSILQKLMNKWAGSTLPITGYFGPLTEAAVHKFQQKYSTEILKPWNLTASTGLVYLSTLREINLLECPELSIQLPPLIPWSQNPKAQ